MKNVKKIFEQAQRNGLSPILNHKPLTRRDLIGQGFLAGYGVMLTPSVLSYAQTGAEGCSDNGGSLAAYQEHMIYAQLELAGGSSITKYFYPHGEGNKPLPAGGLNQLAVTRTTGAVDAKSFGIPLWRDHAFFLGLWAGTTPVVRALMSGAGVASTSNDDNAGNMHNGTEILIKAGVSGAMLKASGTEEAKNGARSMTPANWVGGEAATVINSEADARGLMEAVALANALPGRGEAIVKAARTMSESRLKTFSSQSLAKQIRDLIRCNYVSAESVAATSLADTVDYTKDPDLLADLALSLDTANNPTPPGRTPATPTPNPVGYATEAVNAGDTRAMLSQLYLALTGNGNILNIVLGGYDYHQQDVSQNNQKDFNVGLLAGRYFSAVHYYNKKHDFNRAASLCIVTDGAAGGLGAQNAGNVVLGDGDNTAGGDRGEGSGAFWLCYTPDQRLALLKPNVKQINFFTPGGGVGRTGPHAAVADSASAKIQAMLMNLLYIDGKVDVAKLFPEAMSDDYLLFPKWRA